jgi:hypothetical protein
MNKKGLNLELHENIVENTLVVGRTPFMCEDRNYY